MLFSSTASYVNKVIVYSVHSALDKNEYNHITATYFLLAERKLRAHRQEQVQKSRPEILDVSAKYAHHPLVPHLTLPKSS